MKYLGSKAKIADEVIEVIHTELVLSGYMQYIEPFVGGCNVVGRVCAPIRIASDINSYIIALYREIQKGIDLPTTISELEYRTVRDNPSLFPDWYVGLVGVCGSYGGMWFKSFARDSVFDDDLSDYALRLTGRVQRDVPKGAIMTLKKQIAAGDFEGIEFLSGDYTQFSDVVDSVIYCDPPYANTSEGYITEDTFDSEAFWSWCRRMSERNIVLISEYSAPSDFTCIKEILHQSPLARDRREVRVERLYKYV